MFLLLLLLLLFYDKKIEYGVLSIHNNKKMACFSVVMDLPKIRQKAVMVNLCLVPVHICKLIKKSTSYIIMKRETCLANKYNWVGSNCNSKGSKHGAWSDRLGCWNRSIGISWLWVKGNNNIIYYGCYDLRKTNNIP